MVTRVRLPHNFEPRDYQVPVLKALDEGAKRAVCVWHRRSGKDKTFLNYLVKKMPERVGAYYYFFPNYAQGKKIMWEGIDRAGFKYMDHFPPEIIKKKNESEMKIETTFGSVFRIVGTDNIDSIMGTNPVGCIFSEYALQDPNAWDYIRPILLENGGWAIFNYTPRGRNHGFKLSEMAKRNPNWFHQILTIDHTGVITPEMIDGERAEGMDEALVQQEYWCSFEAMLQSCFFGNTLARHTRTQYGTRGHIFENRYGDIEFEVERNGIVQLWRFPYYLLADWDQRRWLNRYAIGSDVSEGLGLSNSVAYVLDRHLDEIVCVMRSNKVDAYSWAEFLYQLSLYYDNALICAERNGAGVTTCQRLSDIGANVYVQERPAKVGSELTKDIGWLQSSHAKFDCCGSLKEFFLTTRGTVYDSQLLEEASTYILTENNKLEPDEGFLADCVIAAALTVECSNSIGAPPERVEPGPSGWLKKWQDKGETEKSVWSV